ncbi:MAG: NINE protein [Clostridiales bacterium]|nr:NINE protein [Clostridiales bacterium]
MYCRNCGKEMDDLAAVCISCGVSKDDGNTFCRNCGNTINPNAEFCTNCGSTTNRKVVYEGEQKSKIAAGVLGILVGTLGIHNFYLGYTSKAIAQLLLGTVGVILCGIGPVASAIWGLVEGIMILTGSIDTDGNGVPLKD